MISDGGRVGKKYLKRRKGRPNPRQILPNRNLLVPESTSYIGPPVAGISDFVLRYGVWYVPVPFPAGIRKGRYRYCFRNAAVLAIEQGQDYRYVEGYALDHKTGPAHHAWNIDPDGNLFDRTWKNGGTAYLGVVFSPKRAISADGWCYGAFNNPESVLKKPWTGV